MGAAAWESRGIVFRNHFVSGWKLVGHYVKKWILYNFYALAIYLGFIIWVFAIGLVAGAFSLIDPIVGGIMAILFLLFSPVAFSLARDKD